MKKTYHALLIEKDAAKNISQRFANLPRRPVNDNEVEILVHYAGLNYKDALSFSGHPGVTRSFPHVPGIDAAGSVLTSSNPSFKSGDEVLVTGFDLGMNTHGGLGEIIIVPSHWVVPKPANLSLLQTMQLGTAGFTAAQCINALTQNLPPKKDCPIAVTGATGGVGSLALALLHHLKYDTHAISRKASAPNTPDNTWLQAHCHLTTENITNPATFLTPELTKKPLLKPRWLGAIDTIGGAMIPYLLKTTHYRGNIASCGLTLGDTFTTTVYPFIINGIRLIGIDSAQCPSHERLSLWEKLATTWKLPNLDALTTVIPLHDAPAYLKKFLNGNILGRIVVQHNPQH